MFFLAEFVRKFFFAIGFANISGFLMSVLFDEQRLNPQEQSLGVINLFKQRTEICFETWRRS